MPEYQGQFVCTNDECEHSLCEEYQQHLRIQKQAKQKEAAEISAEVQRERQAHLEERIDEQLRNCREPLRSMIIKSIGDTFPMERLAEIDIWDNAWDAYSCNELRERVQTMMQQDRVLFHNVFRAVTSFGDIQDVSFFLMRERERHFNNGSKGWIPLVRNHQEIWDCPACRVGGLSMFHPGNYINEVLVSIRCSNDYCGLYNQGQGIEVRYRTYDNDSEQYKLLIG